MMADSEDMPRDRQVPTIVAEAHRGVQAADMLLIRGLIAELPQVGSYFSDKDRRDWFELAAAIFVTFYGKAEPAERKEHRMHIDEGKAEEAPKLEPTPHAIIRQVELTLEKIEGAYRYATYAAQLIARGVGGREMALSIQKIQEAFHWAREARTEIVQVMPDEPKEEG